MARVFLQPNYGNLESGENLDLSTNPNESNGDEAKEKMLEFTTAEFLKRFDHLKSLEEMSELEEDIGKFVEFYHRCKDNIHAKELRCVIRLSLPTLCYQKQVTDSDLIRKVLHCIEDLNDRLPYSLVFFLVSIMNRTDLISPANTTKLDTTTSNLTNFLTYFLEHAKTEKLNFRGLRLEEIFYSYNYDDMLILYCNTKSVRILLQHGFRVFGVGEDWNEKKHLILAHALEFLVFCGMQKNLWDSDLKLKASFSSFPQYVKMMLLNFFFLLKVVPNPHRVMLKLACCDLGHDKVRIPDVPKLRRFCDLVSPSSELVQVRPASLKHSCRTSIRMRLNENWQLPDAIFDVGLPTSLERYVNLEDGEIGFVDVFESK